MHLTSSSITCPLAPFARRHFKGRPWLSAKTWSLPCLNQQKGQMCSAPYGFGDVVDVLRLDDGVQVVLQDAREVVLQLAAAEVRQDLLPVRRALSCTEVLWPSQRSVAVWQGIGHKIIHYILPTPPALLHMSDRVSHPHACGGGLKTHHAPPANTLEIGSRQKPTDTQTLEGWTQARRHQARQRRLQPVGQSGASGKAGRASKRPRLGFSFPASTFSAVDLPMPAAPAGFTGEDNAWRAEARL